VIERFRFFHQAILRHRPNNLTIPFVRDIVGCARRFITAASRKRPIEADSGQGQN
jgi:hypothetical protein